MIKIYIFYLLLMSGWGNFGKWSEAAKQGYSTYEAFKQRNNGEKVIQGNCPHVTNWYWNGGSYESGGRTGQCGMRKDHKRVYQCPDCAGQ